MMKKTLIFLCKVDLYFQRTKEINQIGESLINKYFNLYMPTIRLTIQLCYYQQRYANNLKRKKN